MAASAGLVGVYAGGTRLVAVTSPSQDGMKLVFSWPPETVMSRYASDIGTIGKIALRCGGLCSAVNS